MKVRDCYLTILLPVANAETMSLEIIIEAGVECVGDFTGVGSNMDAIGCSETVLLVFVGKVKTVFY